MRSTARKQRSWQVWAELLRLPNLFTVPGDILAGWVLAGMRGAFPVLPIIASLCLYSAGLLLNDACDAKIDAHERPSRPIPSGRVKRSTVFWGRYRVGGLGFALFGFGPSCRHCSLGSHRLL
ncbi:MAG: UbiA family prenyltransferase [Kiritimatiellae bacterium]|nr:UbiA family prenyltransferase [Kiritimatiellia bacterium]